MAILNNLLLLTPAHSNTEIQILPFLGSQIFNINRNRCWTICGGKSEFADSR